jgi:hypothetical protein
MMWHTTNALCESKIIIYSDVASSNAHCFIWGFHIMWHGKQVNAQYLEYYVKSSF